ncbi:MAG: ribonuclease H-like YkuK family protein [Candidatus Colwellbacteria bacterium]|nr:ribonuclease H-like YkuK family protein [Candidatus Colwellbacteria bacterium]
MEQPLFNSSFGLKMSPEQVAQELIRFMKADPERSYKVTIGTDSELYNKTEADFVTAIVVHRVGNGGRYFWRRVELKNFYTLRDRILKEVIVSLDTAKIVLNHLRELEAPPFDFEIHVDVGENGESRKMIQELVGIIRAHDFEAKTKPESYAASSVADRYA